MVVPTRLGVTMDGLVSVLLQEVISKFSSIFDKRNNAIGTDGRVPKLLPIITWIYWNGHMRMGVRGIRAYVPEQHIVDIFTLYNGHMKMDALGMNLSVVMQHMVVSYIY